MATLNSSTKVVTSSTGIKATGKIYASYSTSTTATQLTISGTLYVWLEKNNTSGSAVISNKASSASITATNGTTTKSISNKDLGLISGSKGPTYMSTGTFSITVPKKTTAQTITFKISEEITVQCVEASGTATVSGSTTISLAALESYAVTYNNNNGTGTTQAQTKYYGVNLSLNYTNPSLSDYAFLGWATSEANASAGTYSGTYVRGYSYTSNAALTLYGTYERVYQKPIINNLTVERCLSDGAPNDEGLYALVSFDWSVFSSNDPRYYGGDTYPYSSNAVDSCTITVGTVTATPTLTGTSGTESITVGSGNFSVDTEYAVSVAITDTQTIASPHTTTANGALPTSSFPIDVNADGTAVAILRPAPDGQSGLFVGDVIEAHNLPGIIKMFAGTFAPTGWLLCNGDEVAVEDYPFLYDVIGDTYGTPSDSDHFVLPDFRGRIPVGSGFGTASDATSHVLGQTSGAETHKLTSGQSGVPAHKHSINHGHGFTNPSARIYLKKLAASGSATWTPVQEADSTGSYGSSVVTSGGSVTGYTGNSGDNTAANATTAHNNMQPYTVVNYIISTGGVSRWADSAGLPIVRDVTYNGQSIVDNEVARIAMPYGSLIEMSTDLTLTTSYQKLALTNFSGVGCSLSSNGIKIEVDGIYDISASLYVAASYQADDIFHAGIYVNDTHVQHGQYRLHTANPYTIVVIPRTFSHLVVGDIVNLRAYNQSGARGTVGRSNTGLRINRIS